MPLAGTVNKEETLIKAIRSTPIIDNHAHPLVKLEVIDRYTFLSIATEAHGKAIESSRTTLPHYRAVKILSRVLGCDESWEAVVDAVKERREQNYEAWISRCLRGIESVLVDDGLDNADNVHPYSYFHQFTRSPAKRVVRIEYVASLLLWEACTVNDNAVDAYASFIREYRKEIRESIDDPEVVGFKSVICYRTGLAVSCHADDDLARRSFETIFLHQHDTARQPIRIAHPGLSESLVHWVATELAAHDSKKPLQFHTGLGDNDILLNKSSPAELQTFIRQYPQINIVLLHSGYPFARETGYLAALYSNVYADIGEIFPFLSRGGQEAVVRQILEMCPGSKILWSTDGHWFPETYLLAVEQMREVFETVFKEFVEKGDMSWVQAAQMVEDMLFNNSNELYSLGLNLAPISEEHEPVGSEKHDGSETRKIGAVTKKQDTGALTKIAKNDEFRFLRVCWLDMTATLRMRAVPMPRMREMLKSGEEIAFGVTEASLGLLQNDMPAPGVLPTGEYRLHPDVENIRPGPRKGHAMTMGVFKHHDGSDVVYCPRTALLKALEKAAEHDLKFIFGFEIELVLMRRTTGPDMYEPLDWDGHAWSVSRAMEHEVVIEVIEEAISRLADGGVYVEMVHPESANGQYEVVLPKATALKAVDTLIYTREIIASCAAAKGYKMTLHPKPFPMACGTAAHVHMSLDTPEESDPKVYEPFYAGILHHLRGICAFTYSNVVSYERVQDGCWAGGTWVAWGTQNRETPLRKLSGSHWELKCMDGLANPYLAMAAIVLAGTDGVARGLKLELGNCDADPALLTEEQRQQLGIVDRLPASVTEALEGLESDGGLCGMLGKDLVDRYVKVKQVEAESLEGMDKPERRRWILERY
ncbi:hypothetical protein B0I35DRAFT_405518 [Stachybotrys elegans]|uniref:Glutamine synthetase n=1 Tax=Stachybotrys elegans TaxID=80388 RepID=A0A8K0T1K4_9HYPO|nr:hypothetical protein B0I35DRAFT_405518 [Stachybotrys elegans]